MSNNTSNDIANNSSNDIGDAVLAATMVIDSVGSTSRRAALGEVAANEIDRAERAQMTAAVRDQGGNVLEFTGDGAIALFPSASAAISAAFALCAPHYRIGIAVGEVRRDGSAWTGAALVAAARLERRCPPVAVACSALAVRTASSAPAATTEPLPETVSDDAQSDDVALRPSA